MFWIIDATAPCFSRSDEQMHVIAHHDVSVNRTLRTTTRVIDDVPIRAEIQPIAEDRAAICPAVDDVKRYSR